MSQEKLNHVVSGVLYDFMGFLTREGQTSLDNIKSAEIIEEFLEEKGVELVAPMFQWTIRCTFCGYKTKAGSVEQKMC